MALVFQYGSNTSSARLNSPERLCGDATSLGLACSVGQYALGLTAWSKLNGCAAADLVRARGRYAWGVLYEIPEALLSRQTAGKRKSLDAIEGRCYRRRKIRVRRADMPNSPLYVWTYTVVDRQKGIETSREYASHIVSGLREHRAPNDYIEYVKTRVVKNNPRLRNQI